MTINLIHALFQLTKMLDVRSLGERVFNDLGSTWWIVLLLLLLATALSFGWIVLMRSG